MLPKAPIDFLPPECFPVDRDISKARSLPALAFTSEAFLRLELERIFARTWMLVPQNSNDGASSVAEFLKQRGAQLPFSLLGRSLFLQRDWEDRLHCFPNLCTHAWYPLVESTGAART